MILSRSIHIVANGRISIILCLIFHCIYISIYHNLIYSSVGGQLGCFHILAFVNNAMNIAMHEYFQITGFIFSGYIYPGGELVGHTVGLFLAF